MIVFIQNHSHLIENGFGMGITSFPGLIDVYLEHHLQSTASYPYYRRLVRQCFETWQEWPTKAEIRQWHLAHQQTPTHANKGLAFLKAMWNWAINEGLWTDANPAAGIRRHQTFSRERILIDQELARLLTDLPHAPKKLAAYLIILLTTGCRMGEARMLHRQLTDLDVGRWHQTKTKNGHFHWMPLTSQGREALRSLPDCGAWFFPGHYGHPWARASAEKAWSEYRRGLGLEDVWLHDLRRTVASRLYEQERDLLLVKACLNHYDGSPTAVYVRLQYDRLARALQTHADRLWALTKEEDHVPLIAPLADRAPAPELRLRHDTRFTRVGH